MVKQQENVYMYKVTDHKKINNSFKLKCIYFDLYWRKINLSTLLPQESLFIQVDPTASGQVKMTRSMSYVSSFSHLSVARNSDLLNEGLNGSAAGQGFGAHPRGGGGSDAQGIFQNPTR